MDKTANFVFFRLDFLFTFMLFKPLAVHQSYRTLKKKDKDGLRGKADQGLIERIN